MQITPEQKVKLLCAVQEALEAPEAVAALARHFYWDIGTPGTTSGTESPCFESPYPALRSHSGTDEDRCLEQDRHSRYVLLPSNNCMKVAM